MRELPYPEWPFGGGHVCPTITEDVAARRDEDVQILVSAMFDACRDLSNAPNGLLPYTEKCLDDLRKYSPLASDAEIVRLNERLAGEIAPFPVPTAEGIVNALAVVTTRFPELLEYDPLIVWDLSFARQLMRERGLVVTKRAGDPTAPKVRPAGALNADNSRAR